MTNNSHVSLDAKILDAIRGGNNLFHKIALYVGLDIPDRTIDKRLQHLRKQNLISFASKGGWKLVEKVDE